jgi:hypothetical protein
MQRRRSPQCKIRANLEPGWERYGRALLRSMAEVRAEMAEKVHPVLMETADYWLSLGLAIGTAHPEAAARLLQLIELKEDERQELAADAEHFLAEALQ